jgi:hypothetical protein
VLPGEAGQLGALEALALDWTCPEVLEQVLRRLEARGQGRGQQQRAPPQLWPALRELSLRSNALERFPLPPAACSALGRLASLDLVGAAWGLGLEMRCWAPAAAAPPSVASAVTI